MIHEVIKNIDHISRYFPNGPAMSYLKLVGMILSDSTSPRDGLKVYNEALVAGETRESSVSVTRATGANPALTAIADPEEEPRGLYSKVSRCLLLPSCHCAYTMTSTTIVPVLASTNIC